MKNRYLKTIAYIALLLSLWGVAAVPAAAAEGVETWTIDQLKEQLGNDDVLILDVRAGRDWSASEFKIQGAVRANPGEFDTWAAVQPRDKTLVLYCA